MIVVKKRDVLEEKDDQHRNMDEAINTKARDDKAAIRRDPSEVEEAFGGDATGVCEGEGTGVASGSGGSETSAPLRTSAGACAGGITRGLMACRRVPG